MLTRPNPPSRVARSSLVALFVAAAGCPSNPDTPPGPGPGTRTDAGTRADLRLAINGAPGGAFLSAWIDRDAPVSADPTAAPAPIFVAGGYVGVEPARVPGGRVGRLVEYTAEGFVTRCTTDAVLWGVGGVRASDGLVVYAVGERGRVLRFRDGRCETLDTGLSYSDGVPTFWGVLALGVDDVWLVGGSSAPGGPRGVLVHYDGQRFAPRLELPAAVQRENLYSAAVRHLDSGARRLVVVGSRGLVAELELSSATAFDGGTETQDAGQRNDGGGDGAAPNDAVAAGVDAGWDDAATGDGAVVPSPWGVIEWPGLEPTVRLFTVDCAASEDLCYAVGGESSGVFLAARAGTWQRAGNDRSLAPLNGVVVGSNGAATVVGVNGFFANVSTTVSIASSLTRATLHAIASDARSSSLIAVGGELSVADSTQKGVILVQGREARTFKLDGQSYSAPVLTRPSASGSGQ